MLAEKNQTRDVHSPVPDVFPRFSPMMASLITMRRSPSFLPFIGALTLLALLTAPDALDAKRKKRIYRPPLVIVNVTPSPVPFIPGPGSSLALAVTVKLPERLDRFDVLEVSSLISFPSKRSIRFLFDRQSLDDVMVVDGKPRTRVTLLWDGTDQHRQYVSPGKYVYAIRAKLMAEKKGFMQTKTVSTFKRGTLDVSSPPDVVEPVDILEPRRRPESAPPTEQGADTRKTGDAPPNAAGQPQEPDDVT